MGYCICLHAQTRHPADCAHKKQWHASMQVYRPITVEGSKAIFANDKNRRKVILRSDRFCDMTHTHTQSLHLRMLAQAELYLVRLQLLPGSIKLQLLLLVHGIG